MEQYCTTHLKRILNYLYKKFKIYKVTKLGEVWLKASNAALHQLSFIVISLFTYGVKHLVEVKLKKTNDYLQNRQLLVIKCAHIVKTMIQTCIEKMTGWWHIKLW